MISNVNLCMEQDLFINGLKDFIDQWLMLLLSNNLGPYEGEE